MDEKKVLIKDDKAISKKEKIKIGKRGRKPGSKKTGGRQKGTPNKSSTAWNTILDSYGFSIVEKAISLYESRESNNQLRFHILQFLSQYTVPSIKAKEVEEPQEEQQEKPKADVLTIIK